MIGFLAGLDGDAATQLLPMLRRIVKTGVAAARRLDDR
jgi:hypothetical protein